jgi:hypothetical protein
MASVFDLCVAWQKSGEGRRKVETYRLNPASIEGEPA